MTMITTSQPDIYSEEDKYRYKKDPRKNSILSNKSSIETQSTSVIQKIASISILSFSVDGEERI